MTERNEDVGLVLGTDPSTPLDFWVSLAEDRYVQLDDILTLSRKLPDGTEVNVYGMVAAVRAKQDGVKFDGDVHMVNDGLLLANMSESAQVLPTRYEPEIFVPPLPGQQVRLARGKDRDMALFYDQMKRKMPAGITRDGEPIYLNFDFLDGTRGAHMNISGVSGIATKTTYATFILYSMFNSGVLGGESANTKALIFNAKGEDLLWLDRENNEFTEQEAARFRAIGLDDPGPFKSVNLCAPPRRNTTKLVPEVGSRQTGIKPYLWTLAHFCQEEMLPYLFVDAEDERQQYVTCVSNVTSKLSKHATAHPDGSVTIKDGSFDSGKLNTFRDLIDFIADCVEDERDTSWRGRSINMTTGQAFVRRLSASTKHLEHLIQGGLEDGQKYRIDLQSAKVTVVDIHQLNDRAKRFVVGVLLRTMFNDKESKGSRTPLTFVVLDELNKYAPAKGNSPIKDTLLDIAERGRSLGIILIGAQQTASEVERRIVSNSAIKVVGRLDSAEASREQYAWLPVTHRQRATILKPGSMMMLQPQWPTPVAMAFPFPAWATRQEEAKPDPAEQGDGDVFDL